MWDEFNAGTKDVERIDPNSVRPEKFETDVAGITSDGTYQKGIDKFPIFDVTKDEFYKNMEESRKRMRFTTDHVSKYMRESRYNRQFYIRHTDENGKSYIRKIK